MTDAIIDISIIGDDFFPLPHPSPEGRRACFPLDKTTSHSTKLQKTAAKSLVIPPGEGLRVGEIF